MIPGMADNTVLHADEFLTALPCWLEQLHQQLHDTGQRAAVVVSGELAWSRSTAQIIIDWLADRCILVTSNTIADALPLKNARTQLGREYDAIVFDAQDDFDPDAFGAVSGTLCAAGLMIVLLPESEHWPALRQ